MSGFAVYLDLFGSLAPPDMRLKTGADKYRSNRRPVRAKFFALPLLITSLERLRRFPPGYWTADAAETRLAFAHSRL